MKIAKVLMIVLAVSFCCTAVNAGGGGGDDCATALSLTCGSSIALSPNGDTTPTGPIGGACIGNVCSGFTALCNTSGDCPAGEICLGVNDVWVTFVATDVNARLRTDAGGSTGTDSDYTVYSVTQGDTCNSVGWTEVGCSEDDGSADGSCCNGDISFPTVPGDTYLIQFGSWADAGGAYDLVLDCPAVGGICGDGIVSAAGDEECDGNAAADACILPFCEGDCTCTPVPTPMLPKWGLIGLATMLLVGGVAVFGRGRMGVQQV